MASVQYDAADQLLGITDQKGSATLGTLTDAYDAAGQRISQGGTLLTARLPNALSDACYDASHRLIRWNGTPWVYDANGNLRSDGTRTYDWDARNRLVRLSGADGRELARFAYDGRDRRIRKMVGTQVTQYPGQSHQAWPILAGADVSGSPLLLGDSKSSLIR